eukprot:scaffold8290_cov174-Amphora_coffeaeformis.AAC.5
MERQKNKVHAAIMRSTSCQEFRIGDNAFSAFASQLFFKSRREQPQYGLNTISPILFFSFSQQHINDDTNEGVPYSNARWEAWCGTPSL